MARMRLKALLAASLLTGCSLVGAAEITVDARNDSDEVMVVQVVDGSGAPQGPAHTLEPLEERELELAVPGGTWDVAGRTGRLPVTLILPAPDDPIQQPHWQGPSDWAGGG